MALEGQVAEVIAGVEHARSSMRLGDSAEVWCSCGWHDDESIADVGTGHRASEMIEETWAAHLDDVRLGMA